MNMNVSKAMLSTIAALVLNAPLAVGAADTAAYSPGSTDWARAVAADRIQQQLHAQAPATLRQGLPESVMVTTTDEARAVYRLARTSVQLDAPQLALRSAGDTLPTSTDEARSAAGRRLLGTPDVRAADAVARRVEK
jgi:hypothetical protein